MQKAAIGVPHQFIETVVLRHEGDECLLWPFARSSNGRGVIWLEKRPQLVHRIVCEKVHGPAPTRLHDVAHSCGRGRDACVSPKHVSWKTRRENEADKRAHGTAPLGENHGRHKLNGEIVQKIRGIGRSRTQRAIAKEFGVCQSTVARIVRGDLWSSLPRG